MTDTKKEVERIIAKVVSEIIAETPEPQGLEEKKEETYPFNYARKPRRLPELPTGYREPEEDKRQNKARRLPKEPEYI